jgi:hypothetical protein
MTPREYMQQLPHRRFCPCWPGARADGQDMPIDCCNCTRARTLARWDAMERVIAAWDAYMEVKWDLGGEPYIREQAAIAARRALAELEG